MVSRKAAIRRRITALFACAALLAAGASVAFDPGVAAAAAADVASVSEATASSAVSQQLLSDAQVNGSVDVLVKLRLANGSSAETVNTAADHLIADVAPPASKPIDVLDEFAVVAMGATSEDLGQLAQSDLVAKVEPNRLFKPVLEKSTALIGAPEAWQAGYTGAGRAVAIIDSGVDAGHPALAGKVKQQACFSNAGCPDGSSSMTGSGAAAPCAWGEGCDHGTHVAGVIAANGERKGVAPGADLVAIQVFSRATGANCGGADQCPRARTSDVLASLNYVNQLATGNALGEPIVAVNLSLASDVTSAACDDSILATAIDTLWRNNVATVVAAGNSGKQGELSIPACINSTVSVGAVDQADAYWSVSNVSPRLDFFAPGVNVTSTWPGGGWRAASGTSTAAPHVAGAWAVASQAFNTTNPKTIYDWYRKQPRTISVNGTAIPRISLAALAGLKAAQWPNPANVTALVGDYDGNSYDDIYWFDKTGASSQIWWFGPAGREQITTSAMSGSWRPVSGDFNADGIGDIIWYNPAGSTYFWFGRRTRGVFEGTGPFYPYGNFTPFAGDFNGDGYDDVYLYGRDGGPSYIFWMMPTPGWAGFATVRFVGIPQAPGNGFNPTGGDFDGDGDGDIFWQSPTVSYFDWSNRDGTFSRRWAVPGDYKVLATDIDGDRTADITLYARNDTWLWWGGVQQANSYPRAGKSLALDMGAGAIPVAGHFFATNRDTIYFYGPNTPADTFFKIPV